LLGTGTSSDERDLKQNNLNLSRFSDDHWITWPVLIDRITAFIERALCDARL